MSVPFGLLPGSQGMCGELARPVCGGGEAGEREGERWRVIVTQLPGRGRWIGSQCVIVRRWVSVPFGLLLGSQGMCGELAGVCGGELERERVRGREGGGGRPKIGVHV